MEKFHDFDACWQEMEKEPIKFKVFGVEETIPPALPASIVLKIIRAMKTYGSSDDLPKDVQLDLAMSVFGEARVDDWCKKGLSIDQLADMIKWAMEQYNPGKNVKASSKTKKKKPR